MVRFEIKECGPVSANQVENKAPPADDEENVEMEAEDTPKKKGLGLIPMLAAAAVAAGVAGGAAFVLTPGAKETNSACIEPGSEDGAEGEHGATDAHGEASAATEECAAQEQGEAEKEKKKKKAGKGHGGGHEGGENVANNTKPLGEVQHTEYATFLIMEPMVVSVTPIGRSKHLKISLVLETDDDGAEELLGHGFYVQDILNTFLRSVDTQVLEDPAAMSRLRAQILRRVRAIVPDANVQNVLITEFILT